MSCQRVSPSRPGVRSPGAVAGWALGGLRVSQVVARCVDRAGQSAPTGEAVAGRPDSSMAPRNWAAGVTLKSERTGCQRGDRRVRGKASGEFPWLSARCPPRPRWRYCFHGTGVHRRERCGRCPMGQVVAEVRREDRVFTTSGEGGMRRCRSSGGPPRPAVDEGFDQVSRVYRGMVGDRSPPRPSRRRRMEVSSSPCPCGEQECSPGHDSCPPPYGSDRGARVNADVGARLLCR